MPVPVVFLPDEITPAELGYRPLIEALGDEIRPFPKELEVYRSHVPPIAYELATEVEGLRSAAERAGLPAFHLVGEGGGGGVALAFLARYPERVLSLALIEPSWIGNEEQGIVERHHDRLRQRALRLSPVLRLQALALLGMRDGMEAPRPAGAAPEWMERRPAGVVALNRALHGHELDLTQLRSYPRPAYLALGGRSHAVEGFRRERLVKLLPDLTVEVFEGRHRSDPLHRAEPERFANALLRLWGVTSPPLRATAS